MTDIPGLAWRLVVVVFSLAVHEAAHALSARALGDPTAAEEGRVTLNPLKHLDAQGSLIVPGLLLISQALLGGSGGFIFGWAKPVPVDPRYFRRPYGHMALVAAAGPASNLVLALAAAQLLQFSALVGFGPRDAPWALLLPAIAINLSLMLFNLIPLPPLDGSKMLFGPWLPYMPEGFRRWYFGLTMAQRTFGPLAFVLLAGLLLHVAGFAPWQWFTRGFGWLLQQSLFGVLVFTDLTWFWA